MELCHIEVQQELLKRENWLIMLAIPRANRIQLDFTFSTSVVITINFFKKTIIQVELSSWKLCWSRLRICSFALTQQNGNRHQREEFSRLICDLCSYLHCNYVYLSASCCYNFPVSRSRVERMNEQVASWSIQVLRDISAIGWNWAKQVSNFKPMWKESH